MTGKEVPTITVGVLSLQGAFAEHEESMRQIAPTLSFNLIRKQVRTAAELETCDALIIPGGESTTLRITAVSEGLLSHLKDFALVKKKPVWGTCAGAILLANRLEQDERGNEAIRASAASPEDADLADTNCGAIGGMDMTVCRNYFGRQTSSFTTPLLIEGMLEAHPYDHEDDEEDAELPENCWLHGFPAVCIRAPAITATGPSCVVLARLMARGRGHVAPPPPGTLNEVSPSASPHMVIAAAKQDNLLATIFHPELTSDLRWHRYFLEHCVMPCSPEEENSQRDATRILPHQIMHTRGAIKSSRLDDDSATPSTVDNTPVALQLI